LQLNQSFSHNLSLNGAEKPKTVLIIDDVQGPGTFAGRLKEELIRRGFYVISVEDKKAAVKWVKELSQEGSRFLVVADLYMYEGISEGIKIIKEIIKIIKKTKEEAIPIIVYSLFGHFIINPDFYRKYLMQKYENQKGYNYEQLDRFHKELKQNGIDNSRIFWKADPKEKRVGILEKIPEEDFEHAKPPEKLAELIEEEFDKWVGK
jgi:hypothetical protein